MPYDGEHLYPIHVVITLLRENVITKDHCRWGLKATRGVDPKIVKAAATKLQDCITEAAKEHLPLLRHLYPPKEDTENPDVYDAALVKKRTKAAMLEMLGVLNKEERYQWTIYRSSCEDDVPSSENLRVVRDKTRPGELEMRHCCHLLDNQTYRPIGQLTLYGDVLNLREMKRLLDQHANEVKC